MSAIFNGRRSGIFFLTWIAVFRFTVMIFCIETLYTYIRMSANEHLSRSCNVCIGDDAFGLQEPVLELMCSYGQIFIVGLYVVSKNTVSCLHAFDSSLFETFISSF